MDRNQIEAFTARWLSAIQTGNLAEFEDLVGEEVTDGNTGLATRRAAFQERAAAVERAFSALQGQVDELLVDGDRIAWRWTLTGVQRAPFLGEAGSGQRVRLSGTNFQRLANGVVVVHYTLLDALGALRQMRGA
jgi:predicted ester cyclase